MNVGELTPAMRGFVDFFGEAGPRWGLPATACRVHAYLYMLARPCLEIDIAAALSLDEPTLRGALDFLADYQMIASVPAGRWRTSADPWDAMFGGLEARRRREMPQALAVLRDCRAQARSDGATPRLAGLQIAKMLDLAEDLVAIDRQAQRLSPQTLRGLLTMSGRAVKMLDRFLGPRRG